jgi:hypothetical protein
MPGLLTDVILVLKTISDLAVPSSAVYDKIDTVDNGRIGLEDAIYTLQILAGLREEL